VSTRLDAALAWADQGWPVFLLRPDDKTPLLPLPHPKGRPERAVCKGECGQLGHGCHDATTDPAVIREWWTKNPNAGIGGQMVGKVGIDFDPWNGSRETVARWKAEGRKLTLTRWHASGRGQGDHLIYEVDETLAARLNNQKPGKGVDLKAGPGGYLVLPPSLHPDGGPYRVVCPLAPQPLDEWVVELALADSEPGGNHSKRKHRGLGTALREFPTLGAGSRHNPLIEVAGYYAKRIEHRDGFIETMRAANELLAEPYRGAELEDELGRAVGIWEQEQAKGNIEDAKELERIKRNIRLHQEAQRQVAAEQSGSDPDAEWAPTDLAEVLEQPAVLPERFGLTKALYRGKVHWLQGEPESGKSVLVYGEAAHLIAQGETVVVFDEEAGQADVADKLRALGASTEDVRERLVYFDPEGRDLLRHAGRVRRLVTSRRPALVVLDSAGAFLALSGLDENHGPDFTRFIVRVLLPLAHDLDAAVVGIDHLTKKDTEGRYARGSGEKLAKVDVAYRVSAPEPFSRQATGTVMLECTKDRAGVIGRGTACRIAVVTGNGRIELLPTWVSKDEARQLRARLGTAETPEERVLQVLAEAAGAVTTTGVSEAIGRDRTTTSRLLNDLLRRGEVTSEPSGKGNEKQWRPVPRQLEM
jgi:hypothetical protein